jgi:hypothetical protein
MALRSLPAFNVASNICSRHASRLPWSPGVGIFQPTSLWLKVPFFGSDTKRTVCECKTSRIIQNSVRRVVLPPFWVVIMTKTLGFWRNDPRVEENVQSWKQKYVHREIYTHAILTCKPNFTNYHNAQICLSGRWKLVASIPHAAVQINAFHLCWYSSL